MPQADPPSPYPPQPAAYQVPYVEPQSYQQFSQPDSFPHMQASGSRYPQPHWVNGSEFPPPRPNQWHVGPPPNYELPLPPLTPLLTVAPLPYNSIRDPSQAYPGAQNYPSFNVDVTFQASTSTAHTMKLERPSGSPQGGGEPSGSSNDSDGDLHVDTDDDLDEAPIYTPVESPLLTVVSPQPGTSQVKPEVPQQLSTPYYLLQKRLSRADPLQAYVFAIKDVNLLCEVLEVNSEWFDTCTREELSVNVHALPSSVYRQLRKELTHPLQGLIRRLRQQQQQLAAATTYRARKQQMMEATTTRQVQLEHKIDLQRQLIDELVRDRDALHRRIERRDWDAARQRERNSRMAIVIAGYQHLRETGPQAQQQRRTATSTEEDIKQEPVE